MRLVVTIGIAVATTAGVFIGWATARQPAAAPDPGVAGFADGVAELATAVADLSDRLDVLVGDVEDSAGLAAGAADDSARARSDVAALTERVDRLTEVLEVVTGHASGTEVDPPSVAQTAGPTSSGLAPGTPEGPAADWFAASGVVLPSGTFLPDSTPAQATLVIPTTDEVTAEDLLDWLARVNSEAGWLVSVQGPDPSIRSLGRVILNTVTDDLGIGIQLYDPSGSDQLHAQEQVGHVGWWLILHSAG